MASSNIVERMNEHLSRDLEAIFLPPCVKDLKKISKTKSSRRHFASYLVSVVTHPIGLRSSISPYNASLESMLAYLMDMLKFSETQLKKMLIKEHLEDFKSANQESGPAAAATFKKRHSWRPELRVRVRPPVFYQAPRAHNQLDHLTVRVYLFKETTPHQQPPDTPGGNFLEALRKSRLHSATLIRPTSEMRYELKFVNDGDAGDLASYRTALTRGEKGRANSKRKDGTDEGEQSSGDFHLKIRRYYCDHKSPTYILRLEFWLQNSRTGDGGLGCLRRFARSLVHNNPLCCECAGKRPAAVYSTGNKSLYGFTNVKISQVPAYAARTSHAILNMRESQVNTCELITDIRNRRLDLGGTGDKSQEFVVQHLRLYAHCVGHQLAAMIIVKPSPSRGPSIDELESYLQSSVTLDNLLYLPAYAIINQHRLQGNMSALEDQSLRRSALMMLLLQLDKLSPKATPSTAPLEACKLLLMSMIQHEYTVAHRPFDSRTMQEVDPFGTDSGTSASENVREIVVDVEDKTIQSLVDEYLASHRLKRWISALNSVAGTSLDKMVTLGCLRMVRCICDHNQNRQLVHVKLANQAAAQEERINKLLSTIVTDELSRKLMDALKQPPREVKSPNESKTKPVSPVIPPIQPGDSWRKLLDDVRVIENDLTLHWTGERALEGLDIDIRKAIEEKKQAKEDIKLDFKQLIKHKMNRFLAS